ncbi:hypothetical protein JKF63_03219 [Porcisia hertigi]|uniref:RING-type domain-containing protein n=1 Tax=Porcisia hertigi TaxID=2761500 RepID=A0A836HYK9_9TRYP|nr:hypothetical protein JKF63_03219 [Porcisia hertigi]
MSASLSLEMSGGDSEPVEPRAVTATSASAASSTTPVESSKAYERICGICFTDVHPVDNPRGRLNSCNHLFCSYCIKEWAKNTNVCPSCKTRFTRIYTLHAETGKEEETKVRKRNYIAWEATYYDEEDGGDASDERALLESVVCDVCQQCHNAARMIFCDRRQCVYSAHLDCLGLAERPVTFLCNCCTKLREEEEDEHVPLADRFIAATLTAAPSKPAIQPMPAITAPASARAPTPLNAAITSSVATQAQAAVVPEEARSSVGGAEIPTGESSRVAPRSTVAALSRLRMPPATSKAVLEDQEYSRRSSPPSLSSRALPSRNPRSSMVPRAPIDFSKPHLQPVTSTTSLLRCGTNPNPSPPLSEGPSGAEDEYYFLNPTSHAVAASMELDRVKQVRAAEAQTRQQRDRARADRLQTVYGVHHRDVILGGTRKRARGTTAGGVTAELELAERELLDPQQRHIMQERMVRRWAADMLPVLRRRRYMEGDTDTTEEALWVQATTNARAMVRERLKAKSEALRRRREQLVRAQAQREAAALAKLARIIAQHRERSRT